MSKILSKDTLGRMASYKRSCGGCDILTDLPGIVISHEELRDEVERLQARDREVWEKMRRLCIYECNTDPNHAKGRDACKKVCNERVASGERSGDFPCKNCTDFCTFDTCPLLAGEAGE